MQKKYIVRLTEAERCELREVIKKLKGNSQKVRRAQILLKADIEGSNWTDEQIAEAFDCRTKTVENIRQRLVKKGFEATLNGTPRRTPPLRNCWMETRKPTSLRYASERRLRAMRIGRCGCCRAQWSNLALSKRSAMKPSVKR